MFFATMTFDVISIIFIVIALISLFIGFKRGFLATLVALIKDVISFIVASLLCKPIALFLYDTNVGTSIKEKLVESFAKKGGAFETAITESNMTDVLTSCLRQLKIPELLDTPIIKLTGKYYDATTTMTAGDILAKSITIYSLICIAYIVLLILVRLIAVILNKTLGGIKSLPILGSINTFLGGVVGLVIGLLLICVMCYGLTFVVSTDSSIATWVTEQMTLADETKTSISEILYNENILLKLISYIMGLIK